MAFNASHTNYQERIAEIKHLIAIYDELVSLENNKGHEDIAAIQILSMIFDLTAPFPDMDAIRKKAMESIGKPIQTPKP